ncbi:MAG: YaiI/YqxD family protein [Gammaproteobacteria bacterium]|nr:YaiI/YqxD family protein [Gammaproteobacteria bacterium]
MKIWMDGDACPKVIKALLFRAAIRTQTELMVVANHAFAVPSSPFIKKWQVGFGFDVADDYIVSSLEPGDLVVTADVPLADAVVSRDAFALNPRGEMYTAANIKQRLTMRHFNESLRDCNLIRGGPAQLGQKEVNEFAKQLDAFLAKKR